MGAYIFKQHPGGGKCQDIPLWNFFVKIIIRMYGLNTAEKDSVIGVDIKEKFVKICEIRGIFLLLSFYIFLRLAIQLMQYSVIPPPVFGAYENR